MNQIWALRSRLEKTANWPTAKAMLLMGQDTRLAENGEL
jgi:hypothetical protein